MGNKKCSTCVELKKDTCLIHGHAMGNPDSMGCDEHHSTGLSHGYKGGSNVFSSDGLAKQRAETPSADLRFGEPPTKKLYTAIDFGNCAECGVHLGVGPHNYIVQALTCQKCGDVTFVAWYASQSKRVKVDFDPAERLGAAGRLQFNGGT